MKNKLLAFHNDPEIQKKYIDRVKAHQEADEIAQGYYWENGKGCAVGCTIEGSDHAKYETELGIPRLLARLEDRIFEGLTNEEAKKFPLRFLEAINVGADLSLVIYKFFHYILVDKEDGVIKFAKPDGKKAIQAIADLCERKINGEDISSRTWRDAAAAAAAAYAADAAAAYDAYAADAAAAYAADAAAAYDAYAASDAASAYAADAAADAYAADAAADAYAADAYAARKNARSSHFLKMANKLIELLKETK